MVVIEPAEPVLIREEENKNEKSPETKPPAGEETSPSSTATQTVEDSSNGGDNNSAGYATDGFETASEGDLNDNDDDDVVVVEEGKVVEEEKREQNQDTNKNAEGNEGDQVGPTTAEDRGKDEQEEEINEKALTDANNAKLEGNTLFKDGLYEEALSKYEIALQAVSSITSSVELRSVCHANRAACYSKLEKFEDTIKECSKALELNPKYLKVLLRRAEAHEKLEHFEEAIADMTKVLEIDPSNDQARRNILRLKPLADEKREKMKEEMIGKLKEMGNSILGRFGMSVDNFKAVKDPNTGSYSISFQR